MKTVIALAAVFLLASVTAAAANHGHAGHAGQSIGHSDHQFHRGHHGHYGHNGRGYFFQGDNGLYVCNGIWSALLIDACYLPYPY